MLRGIHLALMAIAALGLSANALAQPAATQDAETPEPEPDAPAGSTEDADGTEDASDDRPIAPPGGPPAPAEGSPEAAPTSPPGPQPSVEPAPSRGGLPGIGGLGLMPSTGADAEALESQTRGRGAQTQDAETPLRGPDEVFAEDWWSHARPVFEIHGYFRTRSEMFHNFSLGRIDSPNAAIWPQPIDNAYRGATADYGPFRHCTPDERGTGSSDDPAAQDLLPCRNKTQSGANMRFRLNPELHISDNLRIISQIDILDNHVLGSTPSGRSYIPGDGGGYEVVGRSGYVPVGALDDTIVPPVSGSNSLQDSIHIKRAWGEFSTPVGELRFGRMPNHWGLGMVHNAGDDLDGDYQSTIDRIQFMSGLRPLDLYIGGSWDFPNEGVIGRSLPGGQPYDLAQLDDVDQWSLIVMRKKSPEVEKLALARGELVLNGGTYVIYRKQLLANDQHGSTASAASGADVPYANHEQLTEGFSRRGANIWIPDVWLQLKYRKFRFEVEAAAVLGSIESMETAPGPIDFAQATDSARRLRQYGITTQLQQLLVEDRLSLDFGFGWASGDPDAFDEGTVGDLVPGPNELQVNDDTISTFRFHPNYRVDLILHRYMLTRVQGTYYFNPEVSYDFMRKATGQRLGGGAGVVWSRASQFVQTPGHAADLGIELNGKLYFQSKDGSLNDVPDKMGGFFAMLQYGVMFPLAGMGYQAAEQPRSDTSAAQIMRLFLGIIY
jgi:uncharacterized protein (TIGR04551 family)